MMWLLSVIVGSLIFWNDSVVGGWVWDGENCWVYLLLFVIEGLVIKDIRFFGREWKLRLIFYKVVKWLF